MKHARATKMMEQNTKYFMGNTFNMLPMKSFVENVAFKRRITLLRLKAEQAGNTDVTNDVFFVVIF